MNQQMDLTVLRVISLKPVFPLSHTTWEQYKLFQKTRQKKLLLANNFQTATYILFMCGA